jgi:uncharacterized protein YcbK (DUF882 family)
MTRSVHAWLSRSHTAKKRARSGRKPAQTPLTIDLVKGDFSARGARGSRLIVLAGPGAAARELSLPHAWRAWVALLCVLSVGGSLLLGRKARAWVDESAVPARLPIAVEASDDDEHRELAQVDVIHVPASKLPVEPEGPQLTLRDGSPDRRPFKGHRELAGRTLSLFDVNTKLAMAIAPFNAEGLPIADAFGALKKFLRCRRTGGMADMSPHLIGLLTRISAAYDAKSLQIISAHRRADGVVTADTSQHVRGTAADIRVPGVGIEELAKTARSLGAKGVGIYSVHRFVHVDVREHPHYWREAAPAREPSAPAEDAARAEVSEVAAPPAL